MRYVFHLGSYHSYQITFKLYKLSLNYIIKITLCHLVVVEDIPLEEKRVRRSVIIQDVFL